MPLLNTSRTQVCRVSGSFQQEAKKSEMLVLLCLLMYAL